MFVHLFQIGLCNLELFCQIVFVQSSLSICQLLLQLLVFNKNPLVLALHGRDREHRYHTAFRTLYQQSLDLVRQDLALFDFFVILMLPIVRSTTRFRAVSPGFFFFVESKFQSSLVVLHLVHSKLVLFALAIHDGRLLLNLLHNTLIHEFCSICTKLLGTKLRFGLFQTLIDFRQAHWSIVILFGSCQTCIRRYKAGLPLPQSISSGLILQCLLVLHFYFITSIFQLLI